MKKPLSGFRFCALAILLGAPLGGAVAGSGAVAVASVNNHGQVAKETAVLAVAEDLEANGYALEMPPGAPMGAAYVALRDLSGSARILARVELPTHPEGKVEMHTTQQVDGVSRMRALKKITLPGNGAIEMRPGATHLMVHGVKLKAGESLPLRLVFADGSAREMQLPVYGRERQKETTDHDHGHHHHG